MKERREFTPTWIEEAPPKKSFRSVFKWGAPDAFKHPNSRLYTMLKEKLELDDSHFSSPRNTGVERASCSSQIEIAREHLTVFQGIVGEENISTDDHSRILFSYGKTTEEAFELRSGNTRNLVDVAVHPRNRDDVQKIVAYCNEKKIPIHTYGGGSSVTLGLGGKKGGIALVMNTHMNRILELNEINQTATVEAGLMGPDYENALNAAPSTHGAKHPFTCGHFPQSFEYSSVGGWVVTLGSGQQSSYYGDICDIVISQEYVTPVGTIKTLDYPATATGPKVNDIMKGSEGTFGILVSATLRVFRFQPKNRKRFAFILPNWEAAVRTAREISQGEFGMPSMFRISDSDESDVALKLYGIEGTLIDRAISLKGYKPKQRCLFLGQADGNADLTNIIKKNTARIAKANGGMSLTGYPSKQWEHGRFSNPYLREDLNDYGIAIDTLESGVTWDRVHHVHEAVRNSVLKRPNTVAMTHASHFYPQGTNLYFVFITPFADPEEYRKFQRGIIESIAAAGGSLSHHHGVGRMMGPYMEAHLGKEQMNVLKALKKHFDPNNIMNPGGTLGFD